MAVFNFNEVDLVTETTEDPRRPIPRIETPRRDTLVLSSLVIHALIVALLFRIQPSEPVSLVDEKPPERRAFFLPKSLAPPPAPKMAAKAAPQPTPPTPRPVATPPPPPKNAAISVGQRSDRQLEIIPLERDRDIGTRKSEAPSEATVQAQAASTPDQDRRDRSGEDASQNGLLLRDGRGLARPRSEDPRLVGPPGGLLEASARSVERAMRENRDSGQTDVDGQQVGPLRFDPKGADFTRWLNRFKSEIYRNWIVPGPALWGIGGEVHLEFVVDRAGKVIRLAVSSSSGNAALDRAIANAVQGSVFDELPSDYPAPTVTFNLVATYGRGRT